MTATSPHPTPCCRPTRRSWIAGGFVVLFVLAPALGCGREGPSGATSTVTPGTRLHGCVSSGGPECPRGEAKPTDAPVTPGVAPSAGPRTSLPLVQCVGTLAEYCASLGGRCPTYRESLARDKALCTGSPALLVTMRACGHAYRSVGWQLPLLGGRDEYFDGGGRLIGAYLFTDYGAYCGGTSFDQAFGRVPTCAARPLEVRLCPARR